jgi:hypothetical protein
VWLPDRKVDHDVRIECGDRLDGAVMLTWDDTMKDRTVQPTTRWVGINSFKRTHPRFVFEQTCYPSTQLAAHSAYEHTNSSHDQPR